MKEKKKSINSKLKKLSIVKLFAAIVLLAGIVFSLTRNNTISNYLKSKLAAGDVPTHEKTLTSNGDGTYKLSLTVKGDAEEKSNDTKANVVVILDTSGSMNFPADTSGRSTAGAGVVGRYCSYQDEYWRAYYRTGSNPNYTYYAEGTGPQASQRHDTVYIINNISNGQPSYASCSGTRYNFNNSANNATRMEQAKPAVKNLFSTLLAQNSNTTDMIEISFVTFSTRAHYKIPSTNSATGWVSGTSATTLDSQVDNAVAAGATNWEEALTYAKNLADTKYNANDHDKTYIVLFSDGEPTVYGTGSSGSSTARSRANTVASTLNGNRYDLYGIMAYGDDTGQGYMRTLVSYGNYGNNNHATGNVGGFYYQASNEREIKEAFDAIASSIANAVGVTDAEIHDGTTAGVVAKSGNLDNEGLLQVDQNSYEYWMSIPLTDGKFTVFNNYNNIGSQTFTFSQDGEYVNITWGTGTNAKTARYKGKISADGSSVKILWGNKSSTPSTDFYFAAPQATYVSDENAEDFGSVNWDLDSVDTLLNGVTYEVTFDVWPTQTTLDLIADAKNGKALPDNVKPYLDENGNFKTNTGAKIVYDDTRNGTTNNESDYTNPNPVEIQNAETLSVTKEWSDEKHESSMKLFVNRKTGDKNENYHDVTLSNDNDWNATVYISYGIMKANKTAHTIELVTPGHDFSFAEPEDLAYNWEFNAPVVHPMIINAKPTLLTKVETKDLTCSMEGVQHCTSGSEEFYKIGESYYKVTGTGTASLTAENIRKSTIDVKKVVEGEDKNPDQLFTYNIKLNTNNANEKEVWFSIFDSKEGVFIINTNSDSYVNTATLETFKETDEGYSDVSCADGYVTYTKTNENGTTSTNKVKVGDGYSCNPNSLPTGYYYTSNPADVSVSIKESWGLRLINVPTKSTYTIKETNDGGEDYRLKSLSLKIDNTEIATAADKTTATITGTVDNGNSYHLATFTNEYLKTHVDVEKIWSDNDNQDGKREPVTVELIRNDQPTGITKTLPITQPAKATFDGLAKFDANGNDYTYKVVETTDVSEFGYTKEEKCTTKGEITSCTITNSHTPSVTSVSGTKTWSDDDNRDNLRPTSIFVQLNKTVIVDGEKVTSPVGEPKEVNEGTQWKYSWTNLPEYENGEKIVYTVTENITDFDDYTPDYKEDSYDIENVYSAQTTDVTVTKIWNDDDDRDGVRPTNINVTITPNDFKVIPGSTPQAATVTLNEGNSWTHTWTNLFINNTSHQANKYTVTEAQESGYLEPVIKKIGDNGFVYEITNTHEIIPVEISGTKTWDDDSNRDGKRPESITIKVLADGNPVKVKDDTTEEEKDLEVTISAKDAVDGNTDVWAYTLGNLPKYRDGGEEIKYTVEEKLNFKEGIDPIPSYTRTDDKQGLDIVNKYTPEKAQISGTKIWKDDDNRDGVRPTNVKIQLYADNVKVDGQLVETNASKQWGYLFNDLPMYRDGGTEIVYTVKEEPVDSNYTVVPNDENAGKYDITNKHDPELYNNETGDITVEKIWDDNDDQDGIRNRNQITSVKVKLIATITNDGGEKVNVPYSKLTKDGIPNNGEYTLAENENGKYTKTISGLYKNYNGKEIYYTFEEVDDFTSLGYEEPEVTTTTGKVTITNSHKPEMYENETGSITITKVWDDDSNRDGLRKQVTVALVGKTKDTNKDVTLPEGVARTYKLSMDDTDTVTVDGLYKYFEGEEIVYSINETTILDKYDAPDYTGSTKTAFKVTNKHTPEMYENETGSITITKVWDDDNNRDGLRKDVTIILKASTKSTKSIPYSKLSKDGIEGTYTFSKDGNSTQTISGLYKYYEGEEITYDIEETTSLTDYEAPDYTGSTKTAFKVTNKHIPELYNNPDTGELKLTKIWDDDNNNDGYRTDVIFKITATIKNDEGQDVTVPYSELGAEGSNMSDNGEFTITLAPNNSDRNSFTITKLYKNYQGKDIDYKVSEIGTYDGYRVVGQPDMTNPGEFIITNKHDNDTKTISGVKTWKDEDDRDGVRPESITITLNKTVNGTTSVAGTKVLPDNEADNPWAYIFSDLPIKESGQTITYTITETMSNNSDQYNSDTSNLSEVINTHDPFSTDVTVTKVWDDADDQDGLRKNIESVTVTLSPASFKPITDGNSQSATQKLSDSNSWTHTWTNLYKMSGGKDIEYTVTESPVPNGYTATVTHAIDDTGKNIPNQLIVTNKHIPENYNRDGKLTITKIWNDDNNRDNKRANVTVELTAKTKSGVAVELPEGINPITLTTKDNNSVTIEGLAKYYKGEEIIYDITETSYPNGYTPSYDTNTPGSFKVTNTLTPEYYNNETGEITITKSWDDDDNRDNLRQSVDVKLIAKADGKDVPYDKLADKDSNLTANGVFTLEADNYTVTITGLYANYEGSPITYTIEELTEIDGYNKDVNPTYTQGPKDFIVENHHTPNYYNNETGEITITKSWDDDNNRDGLRKSVDVKLIAKADGKDVPYDKLADKNSNLTTNGVFTLNEENSYTITVTGLYENYEGSPITYTIEELTEIDGYNEKVDPTYTQGPRNFIVENHHEIQTGNVTITKSWIDNDNVLHTRPTSVTMHLFADGTEVTPIEGVTLNENDNATDDPNVWSYTFEGLPVNSSNGIPINYTVSEDDVANYTGVCPEGKLTCINTVDSLRQDIKVVKTWDDNSDQDGKRDDEEAKVTLVGTVTIKGETEEVYRSEEPLILGLTNPWEGSFTNIPIFHNGYRITYNIEENDDELTYYSLTKNEMTENEDTHEISFEITNKHEIITKNYVVTKTWDDEDDNDGMRPESITIQLLDGNGDVVEYNGQTEFTLTADNATKDSNKWSFTFENLPVYSEGQEINYTVVEKIDGDKYERTDDLTTLDIINTHEPEIIDFTINKAWSDDNDRDGKRPDSITIQLLANGENYGDPVTLTIDNAIDDNTWSHTFEGLPKYINGAPVEYTISEESVPYYTPGEVTPINNNYEDDEYTDGDTYEFDGELENTHIPELVNEDDDDPDNDGQITVTKTWDDEDNKYSSRPESITVLLYADGEEIGSTELNAENNWTYTFYEDYDGNPLYKYRDQGIVIVYSIGEIEVANYNTIINGFEITNKYNGPIPEITPPNTGIIYSNKDNSLIELFILFITLTSTVLFRKKLED